MIIRKLRLGGCLESSAADFGNIFHFRKDRPTALNSNIQITNSKQSANPNFQNSKQKHSEGSVLVCYLDFWSLVFVCHLRFAIWNFSVSGKWVKYGAFFPNFKLPFLGTELMRRGTRRLSENGYFSQSPRQAEIIIRRRKAKAR